MTNKYLNADTTTEDLLATIGSHRKSYLTVLAAALFERRTGGKASDYGFVPTLVEIPFTLDGQPAICSICTPTVGLAYKGSVSTQRTRTFWCSELADETPYLLLIQRPRNNDEYEFVELTDLEGDVLDFDPDNCHLLAVPAREDIPVEVLNVAINHVSRCQ